MGLHIPDIELSEHGTLLTGIVRPVSVEHL